MIKVLDRNKDFVTHLSGYKELKIVKKLEDGDKELSFSYPEKYGDILNEYYIVTETDRYVVKEVTPGDGETAYFCKLDLDELEANVFTQISASSVTCLAAATAILKNTGWTAQVDTALANKTRVAQIQQFNKTPLELLYKLRDAFMCEIAFDTINRIVRFAEKFGEDRGVYLRPELNLVSLSPTFDSYDFYTRIVPIGKDDLRITSVNNGKEYLENYQYCSKVRTLVWQDTSYENATDLMEDAKGKLEDLSKPKRSYSAKIRDLAAVSQQYSILSFGLGDTVHITDESKGVMDDQRIVKLTEYPDNPLNNEAEISNTVLTWEELQKRLKAAADAWEDLSNTDGTVNGVYVHGVKAGEVVGIEVTVNGTTKVSNYNLEQININGTSESLVALMNQSSIPEDASGETYSLYKLKAAVIDVNDLFAQNITATGSITSGNLRLDGSNFTRTINGASRTDLRLAVGNNFGVSNTGILYAANADITGKITATSGYIGSSAKGWKIDENGIANGNTHIYTAGIAFENGSNYVAVAPGGFEASHIGGNGQYTYMSPDNVYCGYAGRCSQMNNNGLNVQYDGSNSTYGPYVIDLVPPTNKTNGGAINFHYAGSLNDYTARIIEETAGRVTIYGGIDTIFLVEGDEEGYTSGTSLRFVDFTGNTRPPVASIARNGRRVAAIGSGASNGTKYITVYGQWGETGGRDGYTARTIDTTGASDIRLKREIEDSDINALDVINALRTRKFIWKETGIRWECGMIADEMEKVNPLFAIDHKEPGTYKSVDTFFLQGYEVKAIQELSRKAEELQKQIEKLEKKLKELAA